MARTPNPSQRQLKQLQPATKRVQPSRSTAGQLSPDQIIDSLGDAYDQLARLERQVEHLHRLATLGTVAAGVAHEINNVLTPVVSYVQLCRGRLNDREFLGTALEKIAAGVEATARIASSILSFASPADSLQAPGANVLRAVKSAMDCLARPPIKDGIDLQVRVPEYVEARIDQLALQQVLLNLILNACKAMRSRGGEIVIEAHQKHDQPRAGHVPLGPTAVITVSDTGPGLPHDVLANPFQPFAGREGVDYCLVDRAGQTDGSEDSSGQGETSEGARGEVSGGSGLGLSICRQIIESAGGTITASNGPRGAVITIVLPTSVPVTTGKAI